MNAPTPAPDDMAADQTRRDGVSPPYGPAVSLEPSPWIETAIVVDGENVRIQELALRHPAAARYLEDRLQRTDTETVANVLRRAVMIGLSVVMTTDDPLALPARDVVEALGGFNEEVRHKAAEALARIDEVLARVSDTEESLTRTAHLVLGGLPDEVDALLADRPTRRSDSVAGIRRDEAVVAAARARVDAALGELKDLERLRVEGHRAKASIDLLLASAQDLREGLRTSLLEARQLLRP